MALKDNSIVHLVSALSRDNSASHSRLMSKFLSRPSVGIMRSFMAYGSGGSATGLSVAGALVFSLPVMQANVWKDDCVPRATGWGQNHASRSDGREGLGFSAAMAITGCAVRVSLNTMLRWDPGDLSECVPLEENIDAPCAHKPCDVSGRIDSQRAVGKRRGVLLQQAFLHGRRRQQRG
jgi:hypothetical protein